MESKDIRAEDLKQLIRDVALIKNILIEEGELSDWIKKELKEARQIPNSECTSQEKVREMIMKK